MTDIGANLTHNSFDSDRQAVVDRARAAGVERMIITGADLESSRKAISLAAELGAGFYATVGIHPHHASSANKDTHGELSLLLEHPGVVAAGECGLDFYRNLSPPEDQETTFTLQLEIAGEKGLPMFLHQRDAHDRLIELLKPYLGELPAAVMHCFTGTRRELEECLELDLYVGITGWVCDERRGLHLRDLVHDIPAERLLLETDAPYLLPRDLQPKPASRRNEPMHLAHIAAVVAKLRNESPEDTAAITSANASRFYGLGT
ncbi:MAG: TatD family hydrolase [Gammaproteobacteria bacterium]